MFGEGVVVVVEVGKGASIEKSGQKKYWLRQGWSVRVKTEHWVQGR